MYGTRDAGAIWEQCYVDCLINLGFTQGVASPCCFYHEKWDISVVVHGDDFTALGTDEALDLYEAGMKKAFEIKIRGRLGTDEKDDKEIRILNRILRITPKGLEYEADPRHVELLAKALNLENCKPVATPGLKRPFEDEVMDLPITNEPDVISKLTASRYPKVRFDANPPDEISVIPYSQVYGIHPSKCSVGLDGRMIKLKPTEDSFTGVSKEELNARIIALTFNTEARARILRKALMDGSD